MSQAQLHTFASQHACNQALTDELASCITQAFNTQEQVSLLLPGGGTPAGLLQQLNEQPIAWEDIHISPTDERWVANDSEDSNAQMLRNALPCANILDPRLADAAQSSSEAWAQTMQAHTPFAATLLGMGGDGHIASLFPGMPNLMPALQLNEQPSALVGLAPNEPKVRLSLNLSMLCATNWLGLLVFGDRKRLMIDRVLANDPTTQALPIYYLLWHTARPVHIYWAP
ncbi:MAG TPA: 6-phosphogluconolactonase [Gammaproteobacteria bacterium]|nr:6-phosphogluconolactonase [Gammaproteobacteria bacterium]